MMRTFITLLIVASCGIGVSARAQSVRLDEPRNFGYFIGDALERVVIVRVPEGDSLDAASFQKPGPVNYWLELSSANVIREEVGEETEYRLTLAYQTFYAPLDPRYLTIPGFTLKVSGDRSGDVTVPEFRFLTSPIRQLFADSSQSTGTVTELQPDTVPQRVPTGDMRTALLVSGLTFLASLIALAWHNAWWPFRFRPARPFTEAARYLNANANTLQDAAGYRLALLKLHRAFDLAAGRRVLADDVGAFLHDHPEFAAFRNDVERLFASSRQAFFANDVEQARDVMPLAKLKALSSALGVAERRAA